MLFCFSCRRSSFLYGGSSSKDDRATFAKKVIAVETAVLSSSSKRQRTRSRNDGSTSSKPNAKPTSSSRSSGVPPGFKERPKPASRSSGVPPGFENHPLAKRGNESDTAMEDDDSGEQSVFPVSETESADVSVKKKKRLKHVSQDEINKVAAQVMKAQIRGDDKKHAKLTKNVRLSVIRRHTVVNYYCLTIIGSFLFVLRSRQKMGGYGFCLLARCLRQCRNEFRLCWKTEQIQSKCKGRDEVHTK